jgi:hypothetical protein
MTFLAGFFLACTVIAAAIARHDFQHAVYRQEGYAYATLAVLSAIAAIWAW